MRIYKIAGQEVKAQKGTLNITDNIDERTTCSFSAIDPDFDMLEGMEIEVLEDGEYLFRGSIEDFKETDDKYKLVKIQAVDFSQLIDTRIVFDTFEDTYAGDIVKTLIADIFSEEGITEGLIKDGLKLAKAVFPYINGNEAMNDLAELIGFSWYIDDNKQLHFFDSATYSAPFTLHDNSNNYYNLQLEKTRRAYRNRQYIRAGNDITDEIEKEKPSPRPDGSSRTFVTRLPVASKPRIFVDGVEVPQDDIGVNGLDEDRKFYFGYQSNTISQDDTETVLGENQTLEVTYQGMFPILVVADRPEQIEQRKEIEAGSGIYEHIIEEEDIDSREAAIDYARGKLEKRGFIPQKLTFKTYEKGLKAGQLLPVDIEERSLSGNFLIETVNTRDENGLTAYNIKCLDGTSVGGWEHFFKELKKQSTRMTIREDEVLVLLNNISESYGWQEQIKRKPPQVFDEDYGWQELIEGTAYSCPFPDDDLYPEDDLYPC